MPVTFDEYRNDAKQRIESLELWLRRLIDQTLTSEFGEDYLNYQNSSGRIISTARLEGIKKRLKDDTDRYAREVDALLLEDEIKIITHPNLYRYFRSALEQAFPDGRDAARTILSRLTTPRNKLYHANHLSELEVLRVASYSADIIDSIKSFYNENSMNTDYNVPLILQVRDSFGMTYHRDQMQKNIDGSLMLIRHEDPKFDLHPDEKLKIEVEVDPLFDPAEYELIWSIPNHPRSKHSGPNVEIEISIQDVCTLFSINCNVVNLVETKKWSRLQNNIEDRILFSHRVLSPS